MLIGKNGFISEPSCKCRGGTSVTPRLFSSQPFSIYHSPIITSFDNIQGVPGGKDLTSGECSLGQTVPI